MTPVLSLLLFSAVPTEPAIQVKMEVRGSQGVIGFMEYGRTIAPDGSLTEKTIVTELSESGKVFVVDIATCSPTGRPIKLVRKVRAGERLHEMTVDYLPDGAKMSLVMSTDMNMTDMRPLPEGAVLECPARFWFLRDKPKVGDASRFHQFDPDEQTWVERRWSYEGPAPTIIGGRSIAGHKVSIDGRDTVWLDDQGLPLRMSLMIDQRLVDVVRVQIMESRL